MATRFVQQATKTLDPLFTQQTKAVKGQIPAIQQLYDALTQGLQFQNQQQLQTGTQNIMEDASARGVLRSSLPVDARTSLTGQLGAALTEGLGRIGAQRAQDISGVNKSLADIGLQRTQSISSLADQLQGADLREREFILRKKQAQQEFALQKQLALMKSSSGGGGGGGTNATDRQGTFNQLLVGLFDGYNPRKDKYYTENVVIPTLAAKTGYTPQAISKAVYAYRKNVFGQ